MKTYNRNVNGILPCAKNSAITHISPQSNREERRRAEFFLSMNWFLSSASGPSCGGGGTFSFVTVLLEMEQRPEAVIPRLRIAISASKLLITNELNITRR